MTLGTFYGIGIGPGDPELITLKGARLISQCRRVFVPKARTAAESVAMTIARGCLNQKASVRELVFPMTTDLSALAAHWQRSAEEVVAVLTGGEDACFLTLGDPLLYSTYIYLLRAVRQAIPGINAVTVPGITAFGAAASLTEFPLGEAKEPVTIIPSSDNLGIVEQALDRGGTVVIMKIGKRLNDIIRLLKEAGLAQRAVFVSRVGMPGQRVETDLNNLDAQAPETGYLSLILVHAGRKGER